MSYLIEKFSKKYADDCYFIEASCFHNPWSKASLESLDGKNDAIYFVAVEDGRAIGYGGLYFAAGEGSINNIATLPSHRRRGVASAILSSITEKSKRLGIEAIFLEVRESNIEARKLYKKEGFCEVGLRKGFYSHPREDAIIMKKSLNEEIN